MKPEKVHIGATVRVHERHRIAERRGMVGRIADHYGRDGSNAGSWSSVETDNWAGR